MARRLVAMLVLVATTACAADEAPPARARVRMDFARTQLFDAPFPSDDLVAPDGRVSLAAYPNPSHNPFVTKLTSMIAEQARGFATTGGVFFTTTAPLDASSLPDLATSVTDRASVFLVGIDDGRRYPIHVSFAADGGPFGAENLLSIVPLQGVPLPPKHTYAAVVTRAVRDAGGAPLDAMAAPPSHPSYARAIAALDRTDIAALAVFTTGDPTAELLAVGRDAPEKPELVERPSRAEVFDGYCVYNALVTMPTLQAGTPPFAENGGEWTFDPAGRPIVQRREKARVVLTVPRAPQPAAGYPLGVMIRTGGGGDRPLVDRGRQDASGALVTPGSGLAQELARIGFAGASIDGPHGGLRNVTHGDEQFLVFNVDNVAAIRDNIREEALETALLERLLEGLAFDVSDCPGTSPAVARFDVERVALVGHSMGATIAPLALASEPRFRAAVLSGAGASWIENLLYKEKPLAVRPLIELLLGYRAEERPLRRGDPVLTLVQWALEPADPLVYAPLLAGRQILMEQGIVDHYIMPTIADAMSLALGLDLAGDALDETSAELRARPDQTPLRALLPFSGRKQVTLPASGNVVRQHLADGIQDGHEVLFQTDAPKSELRCFLQSFARDGAARVPDGAATSCP